MGFWGIWAHRVAFRGLWDLCSRQHLSPLRGLPGGGTAETDASQGKSTDQKAGRQSGGHRAWLGSRGSRPCGCSCPDCCQTHKPLQLAMGRDKRAKRDAKAQEQLEGRFSSLPACTEPTLGSEGIRLKSRGAPASKLPSRALRMVNHALPWANVSGRPQTAPCCGAARSGTNYTAGQTSDVF